MWRKGTLPQSQCFLRSHTHSLRPPQGLRLRRLSISFLSWHQQCRQYNLAAECMQFRGQGSPPGSTTQQLCDLGTVTSLTPSFLKWQHQYIHHGIILIHIPAVLTHNKCSVNVNYYKYPQHNSFSLLDHSQSFINMFYYLPPYRIKTEAHWLHRPGVYLISVQRRLT